MESKGPRCRVIAVLDDNHNGSPDRARMLIDAARGAGADGIKLRRRTVTLAAVRQVLEAPAAAYAGLGSSYQQALEAIDLPRRLVEELVAHATGLDVVMAPCDLEAYREVEGLAIGAWQVDSPAITHLPLLDALGASGRPILSDTLGSTAAEIDDMLERLGPDVTLLHGVGMARGPAGVADVAHIAALRRFGRPIGYRDIGADITRTLVAVCLGATLVEKPLTLDRELSGPDHKTSLLPHEFAALVAAVRDVESILGSSVLRDPLPPELDDIEWVRASVVTTRPIARGTTIAAEMLALKPPFRGLSPSQLPLLIGRRAAYDLDGDEHVTFGMLE